MTQRNPLLMDLFRGAALVALAAGGLCAMPARGADAAPAGKPAASAPAEANLDELSPAELKAKDAELVAGMEEQARLIQETRTRLVALRRELLQSDEVKAIQNEIAALRKRIVEVIDRQPAVQEAQKTIAEAQQEMNKAVRERGRVAHAISKKPAEAASKKADETVTTPKAPVTEKKD